MGRWFGGLWRGWWSGWGGSLGVRVVLGREGEEERGDMMLGDPLGGVVMALGMAMVEEGDRFRWGRGGVVGFEVERAVKTFTIGRMRD